MLHSNCLQLCLSKAKLWNTVRDIKLACVGVSKFLCCRPRTVPEVAEVRDIQLPGAAGPMRARIYNPTPNASAPQPALIYIHGGGWCLSSVESHDSVCRALAHQANIVVLSLDYRLAPEHVFPAGLEDCYAATQWISKHVNELNLDPARLAMGEQTALCSFWRSLHTASAP